MNSTPIYERHPELFHYTSFRGVEGILQSQTLWATHYQYLNDSMEIELMRDEFAKRLFTHLKEIAVINLKRAPFSEKRKLKRRGGPIGAARHEAKHLVETFYRMSFTGGKVSPAISVPYITSFCTHSSDQKYEQNNGLLSQWRGYGEDGFAIVFDTKRLNSLFDKEKREYYYGMGIMLEEVVYQGDEDVFDENFGEVVEGMISIFKEFMETDQFNIYRIAYDVLCMFTRWKHRGFREEREVRSVVFPMTKDALEALKEKDASLKSPDTPLKTMKRREDDVPYVALFDFKKRVRLPIKRIIVGPQHDQQSAKKKIKEVLGNKRIAVHCSETPWSQSGAIRPQPDSA